MIGWLTGNIIDRVEPGRLVINVHGVGYDVEVTSKIFVELAAVQESSFYIHTIVREDAIILYGFLTKQERSLFQMLIKVNGVGPKLAISILSSINPEDFIRSICHEETALLTKIPGIGKKTADRLIVEMKDSLKSYTLILPPIAGGRSEAIQALTALGYKPNEVIKVVNQIQDPGQSSEELIRQALRIFSEGLVVGK